jgi:hypothetical protein
MVLLKLPVLEMLRRGMYQAGILVVNGCGKVNGPRGALFRPGPAKGGHVEADLRPGIAPVGGHRAGVAGQAAPGHAGFASGLADMAGAGADSEALTAEGADRAG